MTAEIVVMNREAVAMAADSAVTIGGGPKILNTANKIFVLAYDCPIGILIYNNAALMAVPWEIIIKAYRDHIVENKVDFPKLEDYARGFLEYIETDGSKFVIEEQEKGFFQSMIYSELGEILRKTWTSIRDVFYKNAEISDDEIKGIVSKSIGEHHGMWLKWNDILSEEKTQGFRDQLSAKFDSVISEAVSQGFGTFGLSDGDLKKLREICLFKFSKRERKPDQAPSFSGIVFAGYGRDDMYPVCIGHEVFSYLCNTLVFSETVCQRVGFTDKEISATIMPFAQDDVVRNILDGRLPYYERRLRNVLAKNLKKEDVDKILNGVRKEVWDAHTKPILNTVEVLPKDELAAVARTLVNLTSFMRRVSSDIETVGGAVDVAVISKKDGFVWIDRKHYFDISKNLHFSDHK